MLSYCDMRKNDLLPKEYVLPGRESSLCAQRDPMTFDMTGILCHHSL